MEGPRHSRDVRTSTHKLARGSHGYGFTLSGECPPVLTSILPDSASRRAGLVPGLLLLEVNGLDVTRFTHEDVVQLVARTTDSVRLVVSEPDFDVEVLLAEQARKRQAAAAAERNQRLGSAGSAGDESTASVPISQAYESPHFDGRDRKAMSSDRKSLTSHYIAVTGRQPGYTPEANNDDLSVPLYLRFLVNYYGSVQLPSAKTTPQGSVDTIRRCVERVQEVGRCATVTMEVTRSGLMLINTQGRRLLEISASLFAYSGLFLDDRRFFGMVTKPSREPGSSRYALCHIFMSDLRWPVSVSQDCLDQVRADSGRILNSVARLFKEGKNAAKRLKPASATAFSTPQQTRSSRLTPRSAATARRDDEGVAEDGRLRPTKRATSIDGVIDAHHRRRHVKPTRRSARDDNFALAGPSLEAEDLPPPPPDWLDDLSGNLGNVPAAANQSTPTGSSNVAAGGLGWAGGDGKVLPAPPGEHTGLPWEGSFGENSSRRRNTEGRQPTAVAMNMIGKTAGRDLRTESELTGTSLPESGATDCLADDDGSAEEEVSGRRRASIEGGALVKHVEILENGATKSTNRMARHGSLGYGIDDVDSATEVRTEMMLKGSRERILSTGGDGDGADVSFRVLRRKGSRVLSASMDSLALDSATAISEASVKSSVGRVASWALSLNRLLDDDEGVACFKEFMKTELNDENLLFWLECRKFSELTDAKAMKSKVREIYNNYLSPTSPTPVNVDFHTVQRVSDGLDNVKGDIFTRAQREIFSLMKMDCHPRFIRSTLYQQCVVAEMENLPLPIDPPSPQSSKMKKSKKSKKRGQDKQNGRLAMDLGISPSSGYASMEERKERKTASKRWGKRGGGKQKTKKDSKEDLDESGQRTSTATESSEGDYPRQQGSTKKELTVTFAPLAAAAPKENFFRAILPDCSSTIIVAQHGQTVMEALTSLFERRHLDFASLHVVIQSNGEVVPYEAPASCVHNKEVQLEKAGLTFRATFGDGSETVTVRVDKQKTIRDVLDAVLAERELNLESHVVHLENCPVPLQLDIASSLLARQSVLVQPRVNVTHDDEQELMTPPSADRLAVREKSPSASSQTSETSRTSAKGLFYKLGSLRLPGFRRSADVEGVLKKAASLDDSGRVSSPSQSKKWKKREKKGKSASEDKENPTESSEDFIELLSRVQGDRLDDQRVSVLGDDFSLPDFLREDGGVPPSGTKATTLPRIATPHDLSNSRESGYHSVSPPAPYIRPPAAPNAFLSDQFKSAPNLSPTGEKNYPWEENVPSRSRDPPSYNQRGASAPDLDDVGFPESKHLVRRQKRFDNDEDRPVGESRATETLV
eukprot:m.17291 g.17291  ORF g.17291 m.17291 type:complete len:1328 (+) comp27423_c0_seq1:288-4271(+)